MKKGSPEIWGPFLHKIIFIIKGEITMRKVIPRRKVAPRSNAPNLEKEKTSSTQKSNVKLALFILLLLSAAIFMFSIGYTVNSFTEMWKTDDDLFYIIIEFGKKLVDLARKTIV